MKRHERLDRVVPASTSGCGRGQLADVSPCHRGYHPSGSSASCGAFQELCGHPLARLGWLLRCEPMFMTTSLEQRWRTEELRSCMGEQPEETLAGVSRLQWPPRCFLALLSLMVEDGAHTLQHVQPSPGAAGHALMCLPFAVHASLACLPSPRSVWRVSAAEPRDGRCVLDSVCKACEKMEKVILSGAGEEERGIRSNATWVRPVPSRKTKHLCDDWRAAGK